MEFATIKRMTLFKDFYKFSEDKFNSVDSKGNFIYNNFLKCFKYKKLSQGAEGVVLKADLTNFDGHIIVKILDLTSLNKTKGTSQKILNRDPFDVYNIYNNLVHDKELNDLLGCLIETISYTLLNQLVFQGICPHFSINYYWEYDNNYLISYNEYANVSTLFSWLETPRSDEEYHNMMIQIIIGIICIQKYYNMIHGDLHSMNILVHKVKPGGFWKYIINGKQYIVPNLGWLFLMNDYGFVVIEDKNIYIDWYYKRDVENISKKGKEFYDFMYLISNPKDPNQVVLNVSNTVKDVIYNIIYKVYNINNYKKNSQSISNSTNMQTILNTFYDLSNINNVYNVNTITNFIETYNMDKSLNKTLLPKNLRNLSSY
jgi:hypothetical protein